MNLRLALALSFVVFISGCRSAQIAQQQKVDEGQWQAKGLIKDLEQNHSFLVHLNFNAVKNGALRMDVTTAVGTGVASLVVDDKEVRYLVIDTKRFYYGPPQPGAMKPILMIPMDPRWLRNILFDQPLTDHGWNCANDSHGLPEVCANESMGVKITWSGRHDDKKNVLIEHAKASVQISFQSFRPKVEERKNLFTLEAPESYQKLRVR